MDMSLSKLREMVKDRETCCPWGHKESHDLATEQQQQQNKNSNTVFIEKNLYISGIARLKLFFKCLFCLWNFYIQIKNAH